MGSAAGGTPRKRIAGACEAWGADVVVSGCIALLERDEVDPELIAVLGGAPASWALDDWSLSGPDYWLRVWAARGLLWAWDDTAAPALLSALSDEAWRVREMAAKVVARHRVDEALDLMVDLRDHDPVARVRAAADRAVRQLVEGSSSAS